MHFAEATTLRFASFMQIIKSFNARLAVDYPLHMLLPIINKKKLLKSY